jgi:glyceraldehyde 3-phosphate dehydrogenase
MLLRGETKNQKQIEDKKIRFAFGLLEYLIPLFQGPCILLCCSRFKMSAQPADYDATLNEHLKKERSAVRLQSKIGELLYDFGVELVLFGRALVDVHVSEILRLHDYACAVCGHTEVDVFVTADAAEVLARLDLGPAKIDIGSLCADWKAVQHKTCKSMEEFLRAELADFAKSKTPPFEPRDVILYGFGRIGRLAARELILQAGKGLQLRLRAVVTRDKKREDIVKRAALFVNDSVHGPFKGTVAHDVENQTITMNGMIVKFISASKPEEIDYTQFGIKNALVIDNTGAHCDKVALSRHLQAKGVANVLLTAPGSGIPNVVYGINHESILRDENVVCAASCTTNAISPILKVVEDSLGIEHGHIETIHSFTNDQNLIDNFHKKARRGRSAALNMVITETGAGKAVKLIIPSLSGKLTANAIRVPTPNASIAVLSLHLKKATTVEEINNIVRQASISGNLASQIHYSIDPELVSTDVIGNSCCTVFDSIATIVHDGGVNAVLYCFYDNEYGYTRQVIRLAKHVAGVRRKTRLF